MEFTLVETKKKFKNGAKPLFKKTIYEKTQESTQDSTRDSTQEIIKKKMLSQEEMTEILISKIKLLDNVDIKTKEINKEKGTFYSINVRSDLSKIGNGIFHSAKLNTVSHINRIVNIKLVFSDNEHLHHDMRINIDAIFQCFREIAPDTITSINMETFKDQIENEHLSIVIETIKRSSLIYVYSKMIEFVNVINEKYGSIPSSNDTCSINDIAEEIINETSNETSNETKNNETSNETEKESTIQAPKVEPIIAETKVESTIVEPKVESNIKESKVETITQQEVKDNKTIIHNSILSVIENLEKEEKRLVLELENIRKLIKSQNIILDTSKKQNKTTKVIETQETKVMNEVDKTSFAYKVTHGSV